MAIDIKESISMIRKMVKGYMNGNLETGIKANLKMIIDMGMERCTGVMGPVIKDNG